MATWPSLTGSGAVKVLIEDDLDAAWDNLPLYWRDASSFRLFIWHLGTMSATPTPALLQEQDQALLAVIEAAFPAMNAEVAQQQALARNAPPPAAPNPNDRVFWRIKADWSVDTDSDGSPDWTEFEISEDSSHPLQGLADPFNADVDGNGVLDGEQLDTDKDGIPDGEDSMPSNPQISAPITSIPRYAVFPASTASPPGNSSTPLQINEKGTVLFTNGIWNGGGWTPLATEGEDLSDCIALGINDSDEIIGKGNFRYDEDPNSPLMPILAHWQQPGNAPAPVIVGEEHAFPIVEQGAGILAPGPVISNDGRVIAIPATIIPAANGNPSSFTTEGKKNSIWTLPGNGRTAALGTEVPQKAWIASENTYWGTPDPELGMFVGVPGNPPDLPNSPTNVVVTGNAVHAFYPKDDLSTQTFIIGKKWEKNDSLGAAIDMASDGTAIGKKRLAKTAPILVNGEWIAGAKLAPQLPSPWSDNSTELLDTTSGGLILARIAEQGESDDVSIWLPVRAEGNYLEIPRPIIEEGAGVDAFSIGSTQPGDAVKDRIWIMAPEGTGETMVKVRAPLSASSALKLSAAGLKFDNETTKELLLNENFFAVRADPGTASGSEIPISLKLTNGPSTVESISSPLAAKVMKRRTIGVTVYKVTETGTTNLTPTLVPSDAALDAYLENIFLPQLNITFSVSVVDNPLLVDWDPQGESPGNGIFDVGIRDEYSAEQAMVVEAIPEEQRQRNFRIFLIASSKPLDGDATGVTHRVDRNCFVLASPYQNRTVGSVMSDIAHELGHLFVGYGHPDNRLDPGLARLPGTNDPERLMSAAVVQGIESTGRILVKREWDEADRWLTIEENAGRLGQ